VTTLTKTATQTASKPETSPAKAPPSRFSSSRSVLLQRKCACSGTGGGCEACQTKDAEEQQKKQEQKLQKSSSGPSRTATAPPVVNQVLNSPGRALDAPTRSYMEPRFGRDFSGVRVHTDSRAADSARAVDAQAYTVGQHIVFGHGKYDPDSRGGQHLLAHELAHTVQQHGLQRSSDNLSLGETSEYRRLESEADSIAYSVTSGNGGRAMPPLTSRPSQPMISRAKKDKSTTASSEPPTKEEDSQRDWEEVVPGSKLGKAGVKQIAKPGKDVNPDVVAVNMRDALKLPAEKGDSKTVETLWQSRADGGALEALVDISGTVKESPRIATKQGRPDTKTLRKYWLQKFGWSVDAAPSNWKEAGGDKEDFDPPQAGKKTCHVDHIVELQFGGTNIPGNMAMLDGSENMFSGRTIFQDLTAQAAKIRDAMPDAQNVILHYEKVKQEAGDPGPCVAVEKAAPGVKGGKAKIEGEEYEVKAGGTSAKLILPEGKKKRVQVREQPAATIVPGMLLDFFNPKGGPGKDTIDAIMDVKVETGTKTRLPITIDKEEPFMLSVASDRSLKLPKKKLNLKFHYPYLSDGAITELKLEEDGSMSGAGKIKPTVSFLPELDVAFDKDSFKLSKDILPEKLKRPFPGTTITKAAIALQLAPEFKPSGNLEFVVKPGAKKLLEGKVEITTDGKGLIAKGELRGFLPGIDDATGTITYQDDQWSGEVNIATTQLQGKLKYVKGGRAKLGVTGKQVTASGQVDLEIPHTSGVSVSLAYAREKFLFKGKGTFNPPRLKPVAIEVEYDGEHISGSAETEFEFHKLSGHLKIKYHDDKFSGEGDVEIKKGKATGGLHVFMEAAGEHPKFYGEGHVSYQVSENLIASAGIEIDKNEKVHLKGALEFPKPIPLFKPFGGNYTIFEIGVSIPIPGASIGGVGLNARIEGSLSAGYQIGPGELRNVKVGAEFDPLEEKPDLDVLMKGQLYIGAHAHVKGSISGGLEISIGIASVSGLLTVSAEASLDGQVLANIEIHYQKDRLTTEADFSVLLALVFLLALDATVRAKAGIGWLSVETHKTWNLKTFKYDPGLKLGMKLKKPISYASDQGFQIPSLDDIEWITPKLDPGDILDRVFSGASSKEE
jgi:hypothetical protein